MSECTCPDCGSVHEHKPARKPRSAQQRKRHHAVARAARFHWREDHHFKPKSDNHMRYWLTIQAGFCDVLKHIRVNSQDVETIAGSMLAALRISTDERTHIEIDGQLITFKQAKTTKESGENAMSHDDFNRLCSEIDAVLFAELGKSGDELLKQTRDAA